MNEHEKYFFDLNGYLVIEDAMTPEQVAACNEAVDHNPGHGGKEKSTDTPKALAGDKARVDLNGMLTWPKPWCQPFRDLIDSPIVAPYLTEVLGPNFLLDHLYGISMTRGAEGLNLHLGGGITDDFGQTHFFYRFHNGRMRCGLTTVTFLLTDQGPGDGGFNVVPGSHKSNYPTPLDVESLERDIGVIKQIEAKAGSAVMFTEALTHGTYPWKAAHERRALLYKYTPGTLRMAQSYLNEGVEDVLGEFTGSQRAMMNPIPVRQL